MKITECLAAEHRVFTEQIGLIERAIGDPDLYLDLALKAMVEMLSVPLERHTHTEEEVLFPALEAHLERTTGPLTVMDAEHQEIRQILDTISAGQDIRNQASRLVGLLQGHIQKEDRVLFPMAEQFFGTETLTHLAEKCSKRC
ncbi:MAG: hemerythrin domain-containing protein [Candidatus Binatia bacterium]